MLASFENCEALAMPASVVILALNLAARNRISSTLLRSITQVCASAGILKPAVPTNGNALSSALNWYIV